MKKLLLALIVTISSYAACDSAVQTTHLSQYRTLLGDYCALNDLENGEFILVRDSETPQTVNFKIIRKGDRINRTVFRHRGTIDGIRVDYGNTVIKTREHQVKNLQVSFKKAKKLDKLEVEFIKLSLDFSKDRIQIKDITIDSPYDYKINKDTWWLGQDLDLRIKFIQRD